MESFGGSANSLEHCLGAWLAHSLRAQVGRVGRAGWVGGWGGLGWVLVRGVGLGWWVGGSGWVGGWVEWGDEGCGSLNCGQEGCNIGMKAQLGCFVVQPPVPHTRPSIPSQPEACQFSFGPLLFNPTHPSATSPALPVRSISITPFSPAFPWRTSPSPPATARRRSRRRAWRTCSGRQSSA